MKTLSIKFTMLFFFFGRFAVLQKIMTHYKAFPIKHSTHNSSPFYAKKVLKEKKILTLIMANTLFLE